MVFAIYWHGGNLGHVTKTIFTKIMFPLPMEAPIKFGMDCPIGSQKMFENDGHKHVKLFTIFRCGGHLGYVTRMLYLNFLFPVPWRLYVKFGFVWSSGFREKDLSKMEDNLQTDTRAWV